MAIELFYTGTELKSSVIEKPDLWSGLIQQVHHQYPDNITSASNWASYILFPFWTDIDFIGIKAHDTREKEDQIYDLSTHEEAKSRALESLFVWFYPKNWWVDGLLWKGYPRNYRMRNKTKVYIFQAKKAQDVLKKWYKINLHVFI